MSVDYLSQTFKTLRLNVISVAKLVAMFAITFFCHKSVAKVATDVAGSKSQSLFYFFFFLVVFHGQHTRINPMEPEQPVRTPLDLPTYCIIIVVIFYDKKLKNY